MEEITLSEYAEEIYNMIHEGLSFKALPLEQRNFWKRVAGNILTKCFSQDMEVSMKIKERVDEFNSTGGPMQFIVSGDHP